LKTQLTKYIKRHLFVYLTVTALALATPQFDLPAEAGNDSGFFFILEGRGAYSDGDESAWWETHSGEIDTVDPDIGYGGRAGVGYRSGKNDFGVFYSGLHVVGDKEHLPFGLTTVLPLLGIGVTEYQAGFSDSEATYHVIDFEAGHNFNLGQVDVRIFGGLRYANIDQDVMSTLYTPGAWYLEEVRNVNFWGAGLRLGANAQAPLFGPFSVAASVSAAALFGEQNTVTVQDQTAGSPNLVYTRASRSEFRTAGSADGELGLSYKAKLGNASTLIFTAGYRAEAWFGVNNTQSEPPTDTGTIYGSMHADQFNHGPFLRGEWRFD
jgi:hypothetical protein